MQPSVSVIVAVYNAEGTLRRCFYSLISQSFREMEVAVFYEGSTDGSTQICDEYSVRIRLKLTQMKGKRLYDRFMNDLR